MLGEPPKQLHNQEVEGAERIVVLSLSMLRFRKRLNAFFNFRPPILHPKAEKVREPLSASRAELRRVPGVPRARGLLSHGRHESCGQEV